MTRLGCGYERRGTSSAQTVYFGGLVAGEEMGSLAKASPFEALKLKGTIPLYEECLKVFSRHDWARAADRDCRQIERNLQEYCLNRDSRWPGGGTTPGLSPTPGFRQPVAAGPEQVPDPDARLMRQQLEREQSKFEREQPEGWEWVRAT